MPWCPNCREEYREGFSICGDCGAELVEQLPTFPEKQRYDIDYRTELIDQLLPLSEEQCDSYEELCLTTAYDMFHANIIGSLLTSFGIPYRLKYRGTGDYLQVVCGMTIYGIDVFVPGSGYQDAFHLLASEFETGPEQFEDQEDGFDEAAFDEWYRRYQRRRRLAAVLMLFI